MDHWSLLANILQMKIISKPISCTTTNQFTNTLMVNGAYFMGDFGKLKPAIGLKLVITHKAMVGVKSMQNALDILDPSGDITAGVGAQAQVQLTQALW